VRRVRVFDRDASLATRMAELHGNDRAVGAGLDVNDAPALRRALEGCDAALAAVSYKANLAILEACIDVGCHGNDLGGNNEVVQRQFDLSARATAAGVAWLPDTGLAPGLASLLAAAALERLPEAHSLRVRCGGIPLHPRPPFSYQLVFSVEGLINEYKEPTWALREGRVLEVPTLGELEEEDFPAPFGRLEAFNTSGGASTLPWTFQGRLRNLDYKTLRYPGHLRMMRELFALGLFDERPMSVDGASVVPRHVAEACLARAFSGEDPDAILLRVEARSETARLLFDLVDTRDEATGLTAMMRCTAFPAAILTHMLASGLIAARGVLRQESVVPTEPFLAALRDRGLRLQETRA
jgi:lysine 6-dehydrogenase